MGILIREAQLTDYGVINALYAEELAYHVELKPDIFQMAEPVITLQGYKEQLEKENVILFVAEVDRSVAGVIQIMVHVSPNDPIFKKRTYAHIEDIVVAETYRGKGIGRSLMVTAQKWAKDQEAPTLGLWVWSGNNRAISFYEDLGFTITRQAMQLELE